MPSSRLQGGILNSEYAIAHPDWRSEPRRMNAAVRVAYRELP